MTESGAIKNVLIIVNCIGALASLIGFIMLFKKMGCETLVLKDEIWTVGITVASLAPVITIPFLYFGRTNPDDAPLRWYYGLFSVGVVVFVARVVGEFSCPNFF